ncbi:helix-turn-helix transcriptional regulator [Rhodococcoides trifolii]|uniref:helix-turn-helix transcriptional regulator n=1 Tax=Rhodococcoides trifolii TaxID=908250 RepID=UPI0016644C09|nr:LuxR family transcriptional regulator [Rhodococcus trifolii]
MPHHPPVVGRREVVDDLLAAVATGVDRSVLVVVDGAPGMGTTAVVDAVAAAFAGRLPHASVTRVAAVPWESTVPFGIVGQLTPGADWAVDAPDSVEDARSFAAAVSPDDGPPVLIVVDDAHDADPESLQLLASMVRHVRSRGITVVCSRHLRPAGSPAAQDILDKAADECVTVAPLTVSDVSELAAVRGVVLPQSAAAHLLQHTGGRPRHIVALLEETPRATWRGSRAHLPAPAFVESRIRAELSRSDPTTRALAEAVAIMSTPTSIPVVCAVSGVGDPWDALDTAVASGLVLVHHRPTAILLETPDPMVRAAILATVSLSERSRLHRRAVDVVEDQADALAHIVESMPLPDDSVSAQLVALAGERAAKGEWGSAARLYELSSRSSRDPAARDERLVLAVDAMIGAGDVPGAAAYSAEIESLRETPMRNAVLGYLAILRGRPHEAEERLRRAWESVRTRHDPHTAAIVCHRQVLHNLARCHGGELVMWADRAVELVGADDATAVEAQSIRGLGLGGTGRTAEALSSYSDLWSHASTGAVGQRVQMGAGWLHLAADRVDTARAELESASPTDFLGGSTRISLWAHAWLGRTYFLTGEWDAALRVVGAGIDLVDRSGSVLIAPLLHWTATQIHALRGDWRKAENSARDGDAGARDYEIMRVPACLAHAAMSEARADYPGVLRALAPLTEEWAADDISEPGFWPWADVYANALVVEGRLDEAEGFLDIHERRATVADHRSTQARLGYARGRLHGARGDLDAARASFDSALGDLADLPLIYDRARVNFAYGQTLRRAGKRREADVVISAARECYLSIGASTYVARCDRELKAGGMRAVLRDRPLDALTPQEDAVAALVSTGLSNREVAAELFLSVKTVQFHLTRVYAKLGIRSRAELAAKASAG